MDERSGINSLEEILSKLDLPMEVKKEIVERFYLLDNPWREAHTFIKLHFQNMFRNRKRISTYSIINRLRKFSRRAKMLESFDWNISFYGNGNFTLEFVESNSYTVQIRGRINHKKHSAFFYELNLIFEFNNKEKDVEEDNPGIYAIVLKYNYRKFNHKSKIVEVIIEGDKEILSNLNDVNIKENKLKGVYEARFEIIKSKIENYERSRF